MSKKKRPVGQLKKTAKNKGAAEKVDVHKAEKHSARSFLTRNNVLFCCAASFFVAVLWCIIVLVIQKTRPFGDNYRLFADQFLEYWPYLVELRDKLHSGGSVFYSWATGMGGSFWGSLCYYLLSPFNAILMLVPGAALPGAISLLIDLRQCLAAACMTAFLCLRKNGKPGGSAIACGVLYAFCGWFVSYSYNIIWLDVFFLTPLLALGVERIILTGKVRFYAVIFGLMLFSNFYFSWFAALFAILYFLVFYFTNYRFLAPWKTSADEKAPFFQCRFWHAGLRFAGASFVCAAVLGVILVPLLLLLISGAPENSFTDSYATLFRDFPKQVSALLSGSRAYGFAISRNLASLYAGLLPLAALPLLPFLPGISKKEKWITFGLIVFFLLSFNLPFLDRFWHVFRTVTTIPFRETFLFAFFLIAAAHRVLTHLSELPKRAWFVAGGTAVVILVFAIVHLLTAGEDAVITAETVSLNAVALLVTVFLLAALSQNKSRLSAVSAVALSILVCLDALNHKARNPQIMPPEDYKALTTVYDDTKTLVQTTEDTTPFFRTYLRTTDNSYGNYGAVTGLRGIYQSASVTETNFSFLHKLGMDTNESNYVGSDLQTPAFNSLFGVKYTAEANAFIPQSQVPVSLRNCAAEGYYKVADNGNVQLYRYEYALPVGFVTDSAITQWSLADHAAPENQNAFFRLAAGSDDLLVKAAVAQNEPPVGATVRALERDVYEYECADADAAAESAKIVFDITPSRSGPLYVYVDMQVEKFIAWGFYCTLPDGTKQSFRTENGTLFTLLGNLNANETYQVSFLGYPGTSGAFTMQAYTSVPEQVSAAYETLKQKGFWELDTCTDTVLSGKVNVTQANQLLCTSIPFSRGWRVTVDGEPLPQERIVAVGGALTGFEISQGEHTVEFRYIQRGIPAGIAVSCAGIFAAAVWALFPRVRRKKNEKAA